MWLSKNSDGLYQLHKDEPTLVNTNDDDVIQDYICKSNQTVKDIPQWLAVELCNIYNKNRPTKNQCINLPTHKARTYSYNWFILLTREWNDLKNMFKTNY